MLGWIGVATAAETMQFGNGLRVALDPDPRQAAVTVAAVVEAGRLDDPEGAEGTAHVVEHLWFDARRGDGIRTSAALSAAGCEATGFTSAEAMLFVTRCPASRLDLVLERELARLEDPLAGVDPDDVTRALAVVGHEEAERGREVMVQVIPRLYEALYPAEHPIVARDARPEVAELTLDGLRAWTAEEMVPGRATVAITGGFDPVEVRAALQEAFGAPTGSVLPVSPRVAPRPRRTLRPAPRELELPIDHPGIALGWAPPDRISGLEGSVMAEMVGRVLQVRWRGDPRVIGASCGTPGGALGDPVVCWVQAADDAPLDALAAEVRQAADGLWTGFHKRFTRKRFATARAQARLGALGLPDHRSTGPLGWAALLAEQIHRQGAVDLEAEIAWLERLSARRLLDAAREHLAPPEAAVLVVRPARPVPELVATAPLPPPPPADEPVVAPAEPPPEVEVGERTLGNGVRVVAVRRPDAVLLHGAARLAGAPDPRVVLAVGSATFAVPEALERSVLSAEHSTPGGRLVVVHGAPGDPPSVAGALALKINGFEPSMGLLLTLRAQGRAATAQQALEAGYWAAIVPRVATDPSGWPAWDALGRTWTTDYPLEDVARAFLHTRSPDRIEVALVGPLEVERMLDAAEVAFSAYGPTTEPPPAPLELRGSAWTGERLVVVDDPTSDRVEVSAACPLPDGDPVARQVAAQALWQRLWARLREAEGLVYTPGVAVEGGRLVVDVQGSWSAASALVGAIEQELAAVESGEDRLFEVARARVALGSPALGGPLDALAFAMGEDRLRTAAEIRGFDGRLAAVDGAAVGRAVAGCGAGLAFGLAGPGEAVAEQLRADGRALEVLTPEAAGERVAATLP